MTGIIELISTLLSVLLTAAYFYQIVYLIVGIKNRRPKALKDAPPRPFAAVICARNESAVIEDIIKSLKEQNYPQEMLDIYVIADNCTDDTAKKAAYAGAFVYERFNREKVGKGYALDFFFKQPKKEYDGYFIFDADNIVHKNFVREINKTRALGYEVITSRRNSKNFGANWISAGYGVWFLKESKFLQNSRMILGNTCTVTGTGFFVSQKVIEQNGGWPFFLLTEDIQFSVDCALKGIKAGYCDSAVIYDEQPETFSQSWYQRLRWSKGFYQVDAMYMGKLIKGVFKNKGRRFWCFDMLMTIAPGMLFSMFISLLNVLIFICLITQPGTVTLAVTALALEGIVKALCGFYIGLAVYALITVLSEWETINAPKHQKIIYIFTFPLFMATYIPISLTALFKKVEWEPIKHYGRKTGT